MYMLNIFSPKNSFIKMNNKNQSALEEYSGYVGCLLYKRNTCGFILCSNRLKYEKNTPAVVNGSVFLYIKWHHASSNLLYAIRGHTTEKRILFVQEKCGN